MIEQPTHVPAKTLQQVADLFDNGEVPVGALVALGNWIGTPHELLVYLTQKYGLKKPRWTVTITYLSDIGPITGQHLIEELSELEALIEQGPSWYALIDIKIVLTVNGGKPTKTIEQLKEE